MTVDPRKDLEPDPNYNKQLAKCLLDTLDEASKWDLAKRLQAEGKLHIPVDLSSFVGMASANHHSLRSIQAPPGQAFAADALPPMSCPTEQHAYMTDAASTVSAASLWNRPAVSSSSKPASLEKAMAGLGYDGAYNLQPAMPAGFQLPPEFFPDMMMQRHPQPKPPQQLFPQQPHQHTQHLPPQLLQHMQVFQAAAATGYPAAPTPAPPGAPAPPPPMYPPGPIQIRLEGMSLSDAPSQSPSSKLHPSQLQGQGATISQMSSQRPRKTEDTDGPTDDPESNTTVVLQQIPALSKNELITHIEELGFTRATAYDFLYYPSNFDHKQGSTKSKAHHGYAILNFINHDVAESFMEQHGTASGRSKKGGEFSAKWANVQGFEANASRYIKRHDRIRDPGLRPMMWLNGSSEAMVLTKENLPTDMLDRLNRRIEEERTRAEINNERARVELERMRAEGIHTGENQAELIERLRATDSIPGLVIPSTHNNGVHTLPNRPRDGFQ